MEVQKVSFPLKPPYVLRYRDNYRLAIEGLGAELSREIDVDEETAKRLQIPEIPYETCLHCGELVHTFENYMVHDQVWAKSGIEKYHGNLHFACLEARVGFLDPETDMPRDLPVNKLLLDMYFRGKES